MTALQTGLAAELREVEAAWRGWHAWLSDAGRLWASRACRDGLGATVDAGTPDGLRREIALAEQNLTRWHAGMP